jgi:Uncharacterized protein conserved in bacteria
MWLYVLPFISAFIGWITNYLAIKMLFHPRLPIRLAGFTIQGIFPKRQQQFAEKLGTLVSAELISVHEIANQIQSPETMQLMMPMVEQKIDHFIEHKLSEEHPLLSMLINGKTLNNIKTGIVHEVEIMIPAILQQLTHHLQEKINIEKIVIEKVNNFSTDKIRRNHFFDHEKRISIH